MRIPPCETPGCIRTRGHALSPPDTPCLRPAGGEPPHRRVGRPDPERSARIDAEWAHPSD